MPYEIFESSDKVKYGHGNQKYPWVDLLVGKSFVVKKTDTSLNSLRIAASRNSKKMKRLFKVFVHDDCYEVARLPDIMN